MLATASVTPADALRSSRDPQVQNYVGSGSFGVVISARDAHGSPCAIKKISNVFKNETSAKQTLREIKLLLHFDHENLVGIQDLMCSHRDCSDLYVVTVLMDTDLHKVIRSPQSLSDQHVQYFLYQLLRGLKYIHSCNVLHRDLKPSNLVRTQTSQPPPPPPPEPPPPLTPPPYPKSAACQMDATPKSNGGPPPRVPQPKRLSLCPAGE